MAILDELRGAQKFGLIAYNSDDDTWTVSSYLKKQLDGAKDLKFDTRSAIYLCIVYVAGDLEPREQERLVDLVYYIVITEPVPSRTFQAHK